jgi:hypothetical protein
MQKKRRRKSHAWAPLNHPSTELCLGNQPDLGQSIARGITVISPGSELCWGIDLP